MKAPTTALFLLLLPGTALAQFIEPGEGDAKPYGYSSLAKLDHAAILEWMAEGRNSWDVAYDAVRNRLPDGFWEMEPAAAALAYADANRSDEHRKLWKLSLADPEAGPPADFALRFVHYSSGYGAPGDEECLSLRCTKERSEVVSARADRTSPPGFDHRRLDLEPAFARHVGQVVWWLHRLRAEPRSGEARGGGGYYSSGDGFGEIELIAQTGGFRAEGKDWHSMISWRWRGSVPRRDRWDGDALLVSLVSYLLRTELPKRVGDEWDESAASYRSWRPDRDASKELESFTRLARETLGDGGTPLEIRAVAADGAAWAGLVALLPVLEALRDRLPESGPVPEHRKEAHARLVEAVARSIDRLRIATDPEKLLPLALGEGQDAEWADRRLRAVAPDVSQDVLEHRVRNAEEWPAVRALGELAAADRERAVKLVREIGPGDRRQLTIEGYGLLRKRGPFPGERRWIQKLMELEAVEALVPPDDPLRLPGEEIDEYLARLASREDETGFGPCEACLALARRGRTAEFSRVLGVHRAAEEDYPWSASLRALAILAVDGSGGQRRRLAAAIRPHFTKSHRPLVDLVWAIWVADLRELAPELARFACSGPGDVEGPDADRRGGPSAPFRGRYHLPRQILSLWNEEDPTTRAKLLCALDFQQGYRADECPERQDRLDRDLAAVGKLLTDAQRKEVASFIAFAVGRWPESERAADTAARLRRTLGLE